MKTFEEWCQDREIVINELSPKFLTLAYKIWGEDCFVEGQRYEAENANLRERLGKTVEIPDYVFECINGKVERIFTEYLTVGELKNLEANGYSLTKEAAEARLAELKERLEKAVEQKDKIE